MARALRGVCTQGWIPCERRSGGNSRTSHCGGRAVAALRNGKAASPRADAQAPAQLVVALRAQKIQISPVMQGNGGNAQSIRFAALAVLAHRTGSKATAQHRVRRLGAESSYYRGVEKPGLKPEDARPSAGLPGG